MHGTTQASTVQVPAILDGDLLLNATQAAVSATASLPFDAMRAEYATAVCFGFAPRSMLASRDFEVLVDALERCTLGPFARRV